MKGKELSVQRSGGRLQQILAEAELTIEEGDTNEFPLKASFYPKKSKAFLGVFSSTMIEFFFSIVELCIAENSELNCPKVGPASLDGRNRIVCFEAIS